METAAKHSGLLVKMTLMAWKSQNDYLNNLISSLSEEELLKEISPGRNRGIYLLGHLIAISDAMIPLQGWGDRLFPELEETFIKMPDKLGQVMPSVKELKEKLQAVNAKLDSHFKSASTEEWLSKHTSVSEVDFAKEPHRNKLNVVISRTNHMAGHTGQIILLK